MIKDITLRTLEGRTIGEIQNLKYSVSRKVIPTSIAGIPMFFTPSKSTTTGRFTLSEVIHKDWILQHPLEENIEEPLNLVCDDSTGLYTIEHCYLFKDGYGLRYADLLNFVGELTFIARDIKVSEPEIKEDPHKGMIYNAYNDTWSWF